MGNLLSSLYFYFFVTGKNCRLMMVGLDGAGKTTVLTQLKLGKVIHTVPTVGFNLEKVSYQGLEFNIWDIGGQEAIRPLWNHYAEDNDGVFFIIDAADQNRLLLAYEEIQKLFQIKCLQSVPFVIFLNKQDLPNPTRKEVVEEYLKTTFDGRMNFQVFECVAIDPLHLGLVQGLDWMYDQLREKFSRLF